jgi:hypothetical protein
MQTPNIVTMTATLTRIRFEPDESHNARVLMKFPDPQPSCAVADPLSLEAIGQIKTDASAAELMVLSIPSGLNDSTHWHEQAEAWIQSPTAEETAVIRANIAGGNVLWHPGRAVIQCPPEQIDDAMLALAEFAYYELELRKLEAETAADWGRLASHAPLGQDVGRKDLRRSAEVAEATARVVARRVRLSRIERRLLTPSPPFGEVALGLGRRLREEADVEGRLDTLDGQIETYESIYESANQRMGEYHNFLREYVIEILILLVLVIETGLLVADLFFYYVGDK